MTMSPATGFSIIAYCVVTFLLFGSFDAPLSFLTIWSDRLAGPLWNRAIIIIIATAAIVIFAINRLHVSPVYRLPIFIVVWMPLFVVLVALYADRVRIEKIAEFKPDAYIEHSFMRSLHEAPEEFQFFLHAAALRNCIPYAWSYRTMDFYPLPADAAVNVLPQEWIDRCAIQRTR